VLKPVYPTLMVYLPCIISEQTVTNKFIPLKFYQI